MIELICQNCGETFYRYLSQVGRFCSLKCWYSSPEHAQIAHNWGRYKRTYEHRKAVGEQGRQLCTGKPITDEHKRNISNANRGKKRSEEVKQMRSEIQKALWQDPNFIIKMVAARSTRPTKPEICLEGILNSHLPDYKYNGDGRLGIVLAGLVPDFVNVNGKKQVLEVFGDYWHRLKEPKWHRTELGRIMAYNSVGWDCLIIWEHELKELAEEDIVKKVKNFSRRRKCRA